MIEISIQVAGDHWLNPEQTNEILSSTALNQHIVLNLNAEGPSLRRLGIVDLVENHCKTFGRPLSKISVSGWSNNIEQIPFRRNDSFLVSHFFWLSERYAMLPAAPSSDARLFGFFVGRQTVARMMMLKTLQDSIPEKCLLSLMNSAGGASWKSPGFDCEQTFMTPLLRDWCEHVTIPCIDGHWIHEQYDERHNTNRDLLSLYHKFKIEIVAESYTLGDCFFPTEKTIRPIVGGKPMIVYGPKHYLRRMRDLGFQTWGDCWDESYDEFEGMDRWSAMFEVIGTIKESPSDHVSLHNQRHLLEIINKYKPR